MLGRAIEYNTYLPFDAVINSMMRDVPTWFVDIVERDFFTEIVFNHISHECDVFTLVLVVSIHLSLEILESLLGH